MPEMQFLMIVNWKWIDIPIQMKHVSSPRISSAMENNFPDAWPQLMGKLTSVTIFGSVKIHGNPPLKWFQFFQFRVLHFFLGIGSHNPVTCNSLYCLHLPRLNQPENLLKIYSTGHGHCSIYTCVNCGQYGGFTCKIHAKFYTQFPKICVYFLMYFCMYFLHLYFLHMYFSCNFYAIWQISYKIHVQSTQSRKFYAQFPKICVYLLMYFCVYFLDGCFAPAFSPAILRQFDWLRTVVFQLNFEIPTCENYKPFAGSSINK